MITTQLSLLCRNWSAGNSFYFNRIRAITEHIFGQKHIFSCLVLASDHFSSLGLYFYNSGAIFSTFGAEAEVWSNFNNNNHSKFCKSTNFVNIQPNFLDARKKKTIIYVWVHTERKIVSVRAYSIYSIYIKNQIQSFILLAALRRSV